MWRLCAWCGLTASWHPEVSPQIDCQRACQRKQDGEESCLRMVVWYMKYVFYSMVYFLHIVYFIFGSRHLGHVLPEELQHNHTWGFTPAGD